ncbi:MAG TPA: oligosaccharide repeat unit polymerase [Thermoanaerobacterales bacterium]|nr:oligosaccharide repeat unit polymerase [Thermoanaerobacterales bacterium]
MVFTLLLVNFLGLIIIVFETWRWKKIKFIDFLRGFNIIYFIIYFLVPTYIILSDFIISSLPQSFTWIFSIKYKDPYWTFLASIIAIIGYVCTIISYYLGFAIFKSIGDKINSQLNKVKNSDWLLLSIVILFLGSLSLELYILKRSAPIYELIKYAGLLRSGHKVAGINETSFTFLTFSSIVTFSSYIFLGLIFDNSSTFKKRLFYFFGFGVSAVISLLMLILKAGRLHIINYLLVILLTLYSSVKNRIFKVFFIVLSLLIIILIFLYGKYLLRIRFEEPSYNSLHNIISNVFVEFSFPYLSLINLIYSIPTKASYRYFLDLPIGILRIIMSLISKILGIKLDFPLTISQQNTLIILGTERGGIPVDILGAGYFSASIFGVIFIMSCFGMVLAFFERIFNNIIHPVVKTLKIVWILYFSTMVVLYADPAILFWDGVYVLFPTMVFLIIYFISEYKKYSLHKKG